MTERSIVPQDEIGGSVVIDDQVIGAIASTAAQEIEGVASLGEGSVRRIFSERLGGAERRARGVDVVSGRREAIVDIDVKVYYGYSIPDIVQQIRVNIASRIQEMCGLTVKQVNITVSGIEFVYGSGSTPSRFALVE